MEIKLWFKIGILVFALIGLISIVLIIRSIFFQKSIFKINRDSTAVIEQIQKLQRLESAQFTIEKIISAGTTGNKLQEILFGDKILLLARGKVIAGFDLSAIRENDINISGNDLTINMPPPQILVVSLDNSKTKVYDRSIGIFTQGDKSLEGKARQAAEEEIRKAACEGNILIEASTNARKQLKALFGSVGFGNVFLKIPPKKCG